jgi:hypothetical protein
MSPSNTTALCHRSVRLALLWVIACGGWCASTSVVAGPPGNAPGFAGPGHKGIGGVIDRPPAPRPSGGTAPAGAPTAGAPLAADGGGASNLTQFNRIPDNIAITGSMIGNGQAAMIPDSDGGPALYTILERSRSVQQMQPVLHIENGAAARTTNAKQSFKRYCTVTEVSQVSGCR